MNERSMREGADGTKWFRWTESRRGMEAWARWCSVDGNGLEAALPSIGYGKAGRTLAEDDALLRALVAWARSGEPMAILALESEMHVSLMQFRRQWRIGTDTSVGADLHSAQSTRSQAAAHWLLAEFSIAVLVLSTESTMRSALHARMRRQLKLHATSQGAMVRRATDSIDLSETLEVNAAAAIVVDGLEWMSARAALVRVCEAAASNCRRIEGRSVERWAELAERVWLRDEPVAAAAEATGFTHGAARQRLCRLAAYGRENSELLGLRFEAFA